MLGCNVHTPYCVQLMYMDWQLPCHSVKKKLQDLCTYLTHVHLCTCRYMYMYSREWSFNTLHVLYHRYTGMKTTSCNVYSSCCLRTGSSMHKCTCIYANPLSLSLTHIHVHLHAQGSIRIPYMYTHIEHRLRAYAYLSKPPRRV